MYVPSYGLATVPASGGSLQKVFMATKDLRPNIMAYGGDLFRMWVDGHQAMFGRDVLEHCQFVYNGVLQTFSLAYGGQRHSDG